MLIFEGLLGPVHLNARHDSAIGSMISIYLRHNREFTPSELSTIFWAGGFDVRFVKALNVQHSQVAQINSILFCLLILRLRSCNDRADFLVAMEKKTGPVRERFPVKHDLYCHYDVDDLRRGLQP